MRIPTRCPEAPRTQCAESKLFGRTGRRCTRALGDDASRGLTKLLDRDAFFLRMFIKPLNSDRPRETHSNDNQPIVIMTDACYEKEARDLVCGLGGVIVDKPGGVRQFFSISLSEQQRVLLGEPCKKQIIFEAETLCAVLAYILWLPQVENKKCILFVDNEGTKFSLVRSASENDVVDLLVQIFASPYEADFHASFWITRVSPHSNFADAPSRGDCSLLMSLGFADVTFCAASKLNEPLTPSFADLGKRAGRSDIPTSKTSAA